MADTVVEKIKNQAINEERLRVRTARRSAELSYTTEKQFVCEPKYYYLVSIEDKPISKERFLRFDPDIKFTKGMYTIQYIPKHDFHRNPKFPYLIGQDLVRMRITVSGPRHWGCLCKRIPELGWIERNSTFRKDFFRIAKQHPGLVIRFGVDFVKYCTTIEDRANREGIDIDHKPLFMYLWGKATKEQLKEQMKNTDISNWQKTKEDYRDELDSIEKSLTVRNEIKEEGV